MLVHVLEHLPLMTDNWELNVQNSDETNCATMYQGEGEFWWKPVNCLDSYYGLCEYVTNGSSLLYSTAQYLHEFSLTTSNHLSLNLSRQTFE